MHHRDMLGVVGHRRHERHSGCSAADHDDAFAAVIQVFRPMLRVNDLALEIVATRKNRRVPFVISIITGAGIKKIARVSFGLVVRTNQHIDRPSRVIGRPRCRLHALMKPNFTVDTEFTRRVLHVRQYRRTVGNRFLLAPGPKRISEREHVRIRPNAGISEQIPRSAKRPPPFQNDVALLRQLGLQVITSRNARQAGAHDQYVEMLDARSIDYIRHPSSFHVFVLGVKSRVKPGARGTTRPRCHAVS